MMSSVLKKADKLNLSLSLSLHIPTLCYFGTSVTYPPWFHRVKLVAIPPRFISQQYLWNIAIQSAVGCYNSWANLRCSGCNRLGEKLLWNRSIVNGTLCNKIKWNLNQNIKNSIRQNTFENGLWKYIDYQVRVQYFIRLALKQLSMLQIYSGVLLGRQTCSSDHHVWL